MCEVALLAEGVDRNCPALRSSRSGPTSPSSRRAWIEILEVVSLHISIYVALLAEGVDSNSRPGRMQYSQPGRPPRGGRG